MTDRDYEAMSVGEIDDFLVRHGAEIDAEGLGPGEIAGAVAAGSAVVERRPFGLAVIQIMPGSAAGQWIPHLWVLYVDPATRGRGVGLRFVRELVNKHATHYPMSVNCHGARRSRFYGRAGFYVERRKGEWRYMTTDKARG